MNYLQSFYWIYIFFVLQLNVCLAQHIPPKPEPALFVTDLAKVLTLEEKRQLEQKLKAYSDSTSTQIVVVVLDDVQGYEIEKYALKLAKSWGIGQKNKDNGVLILVSIKTKQIRIELGYGIETYISDLQAKHIIDLEIAPAFKKQKYYLGLNQGISVITKALSGKFKPYQPQIFWQSIPRLIVYALSLLVVIFYPKLVGSNKYWLHHTISILLFTIPTDGLFGYMLMLNWNWVIIGLGNAVIFGFWRMQDEALEQKKYFLKALKNMQKTTNWEELYQKYKGFKLRKLEDNLNHVCATFSIENSEGELREKYFYFLDKLKYPYKATNIGFREDEKLQHIYQKVLNTIQDKPYFDSLDRNKFIEKVEEVASHFNQLNMQGELTEAERQKLAEYVNRFRPIVENPHRYLKIIPEEFIIYVNTELVKIKKKDTKRLAKSAEKSWRKIQKLPFSDANHLDRLLNFYELHIVKYYQKPKQKTSSMPISYYLNKNKVDRNSASKSTSSSIDIEYYNGNDNAGDSFGGGDFGGGGASGDW